MQAPRDVLSAPSHPDPYGWYAQVRSERPVFFDAGLRLWVASGAEAREALRHPALRVRPPEEPVPRALAGRPAGEVFARLVRMNDGDFHAAHRPRVAAAAGRWAEGAVERATRDSVADLLAHPDADALLSAIPVQAMARLLGVPAHALEATVGAVHAFTRGIAPGADAQALEAADAAAALLMAQGEREGLDRVQAANRIALMQQALDATAGCIGNAIAAWSAEPAALEGTAFVERVARGDPAIHNTRRFAAQQLELGGHAIAAGEGVVVVLVTTDGSLGFGHGPHACPGERIALQVAAAALRALHAAGALERFGPPTGYRPLPNARIPRFRSQPA